MRRVLLLCVVLLSFTAAACKPAFAQDVQTRSESENPFWVKQTFWDTSSFKTPYRENISDGEKLAGLSKFWAEVKYDFINFDLIPALDWDALYSEYISRVLHTKSTLEYYQVLREFCAKLKDGHTNIFPPNELTDSILAGPLIRTRLVEERVIVVGVFDEQLKRNGIKLGQEIVAINGISVKQYAQEKIMPYQNASTSQDLEVKTYDYFLFSGSFEEPVEVTLRNGDGKIIKRVIPRVGFRERWAKTNPPTPFEYRLLPGNVAYVALNTFNPKRRADEQFHEAFPQILKSDALILDIRDNGGGNSDVVYRILGHLTDKSFVVSKWRTRNYRPSFRAWGNPEGSTYYGETSMQPVKVAKPYLKPVVVLTSPRTYSAAEDFAVAFRVMKRGLIIGERTGGSTGQPLSFSLPGGGSAVVCTKRDTYPDGRDFVGIGVQPDRVARPTINDVLAGQDTVLNSALNELKNY